MDPTPAEAHWHMRQVENHARYFRMMGNRTIEDRDFDEAAVHHLLDELTDAKTVLCSTVGAYRDGGFSDQRRGLQVTF